MAKFRIRLAQTVHERATVEVEAATAEEAERSAIDFALNGEVTWLFKDGDDPEVISCEPADIAAR